MKKILVIGGSSKLANSFIASFVKDNEIHATVRTLGTDNDARVIWHQLDLEDAAQIRVFYESVADSTFDIVAYFASTYRVDEKDAYIDQVRTDVQVNAIAFMELLLNVNVAKGGHVFSFTDSALNPIPHKHTSYALSKKCLEVVSRIVALKLPHAHVNQISLGATVPSTSKTSEQLKEYYAKHLTKTDDILAGLVQLIRDMIANDNLSITGSVITFDGGAHLIGERD